MSCRLTPLGSALSTLTRGVSGLHDHQCSSIIHRVMQEGRNSPEPTQREWNQLITRLQLGIRSGHIPVPPRTRDIMGRLNNARSEQPDAQRYYAAQHVFARARGAALAHDNWIEEQASRSGLTCDELRGQFDHFYSEASRNTSLRASQSAVAATESLLDGRFRDRRSLYAYEQLEASVAARRETAATRPSVTRVPVHGSSAIAEVGYDPASGRCEVVMRSNSNRVYAYRMTPDEYREFTDAPSLGRFYATRIRGNPDYQYSTVEEADAAATVTRCPTCQQYADDQHVCPSNGSRAALERDMLAATNRRRAELGLPEISESLRSPVFARARTRDVLEGIESNPASASIITFPVRSIQQQARQHGTVRVLISSSVSAFSDNTFASNGSVLGYADVTYMGRGQGYAVVPTDGMHHRTPPLECSCDEYQLRRTCPHIDAALATLAFNLNDGARGEGVQQFRRMAEEAQREALSVLRGGAEPPAPLAAVVPPAYANLTPLPESFAADRELFQSVYDEFKDGAKAYLDTKDESNNPLPYYTDYAFGGLGSRASGTAVGIELEFDLPDNLDWSQKEEIRRRIGEELHALGLTNSTRQQSYGATQGWYRENHERGWSFEYDGTVSGGEITSPAMFDEPQTWQNIKTVCDTLKRHGAIVTTNAGMHVHVGTEDYGQDVSKYNGLFNAFQSNEDLMFRLSTNPVRGTHRRNDYCRPNSTPSSPYRSVSRLANEQWGHHVAINFASVDGRNPNVEFRSFDATLSPAVIQAQMGLALAMTEAAKRDRFSAQLNRADRMPLGFMHTVRPASSRASGENWDRMTLPMRKLIDDIAVADGNSNAKENRLVKNLIGLFAITRYQRA